MKRNILCPLILAVFSYVALCFSAGASEVGATAEELPMARLHSAIESGQIPKGDVLVFVVCYDAGDGTVPLVVLDAPQVLTDAPSQKIAYVNDVAGSSFKGVFTGSLEQLPSRNDKKRLVGAYSYETGRSLQPSGPKGDWSAQTILTRGALTKLGGGGGTLIDDKTGKRTTTSISVFAYYN